MGWKSKCHKVQDSCTKAGKHWRFYKLTESPANLGRTNTKNLLFFCLMEKLNMGFLGDLCAQQMLPALSGL